MPYTNEQLAELLSDKLEQACLRLTEKIDVLGKNVAELKTRVTSINGTVRIHEGDLVALKLKTASSEKRWAYWGAVIGSPIAGALISALMVLLLK